MSQLKVEVVEIQSVEPHNNADRLEVVKIRGWHCVSGKGNFKAGDKAVYFPIDSVLPKDVELILFPEDSKIKLSNSRIRTIKIRGLISQGLLTRLSTLGLPESTPIGEDLTERLGVKKYEPSDSSIPRNMMPTAKRHRNPYFKEYTDIENVKNFISLFDENDHVVATEKIHGTNFRCGWVPFVPENLWQKIKSWFTKQEWQFVYGSRRVQLQKKPYNGFYAENVYGKIVTQYDLENNIPKGHVIYGEIYGDGIQKGYNYGKKSGEHGLVIFEIMDSKTGDYYTHGYVETFCDFSNLPFSPVLYQGPYNYDTLKKLTEGNSVLCPEQKVREGIVVRNLNDTGRKILKFISDEYLLKDNTDFH